MSHKKPVSRRDFLASGLLSSAAMVMAPSLLSMLASRRAFGADACGPTGVITPRTPFICIDLAGGANIAGSNFIVGKQGGQLDYLTAYTKLGLVAAAHPKNAGQVNQEFGIAMHADSAMLRGMISVTSPATRSRVEGVIIPVQAGDDTSNNGHNPIYWISKAGLRGSVAPLAGTTSGGSGGNSKAPASSMDPTLRPVRIGRAADGPELINLGRLSSAFSPAKVDRIMKVIQNLSASHLNAFAEKDLPSQFRTLVDCGYTRATGLATSGGADALDPRLDAQVLAVFPNVGTLSVSEQQTATIAKLVLDGYVGAGTIAKGGYDY
ncbi:MAG: general secretion pathway protein GspF, partial [Proteobacteria bacterium]